MMNGCQITSSFASPLRTLRWIPNLTAELETATRNIQKRLGNVNDFTQEIFFLGDGIQRTVVDKFFDLLRPSTWSPAGLAQMSATAINESLQVARFFTPGQTSYLSWLELQNKLEVFLLVRNLPETLGLSADQLAPLPELVEKAYSLSPFAALWAVEGLGHFYADAHWTLNGPPERLLSHSQAALPEKSLLMLHAGMGLAFAYRLVSTLIEQSSPTQVRETVQHFVILCRANSRDGYLGAAIESLGLVTRDFYPEMVGKIAQALAEADPELVGFFWHGAGRALYFSRAYFLPVLRTPWSAVDLEGITNLERLNLMAGLAWAVTLVNMRQPQTIESILTSYVRQSTFKEGFADGVAASIIMRHDTTPNAPFVAPFCAHQPGCGDPDMPMLWNRLIVSPCKEAFRSYPGLKKDHLLDQIFQYGVERSQHVERSRSEVLT
jgi:hypothetical protein